MEVLQQIDKRGELEIPFKDAFWKVNAGRTHILWTIFWKDTFTDCLRGSHFWLSVLEGLLFWCPEREGDNRCWESERVPSLGTFGR
jgi:hypothetical protein